MNDVRIVKGIRKDRNNALHSGARDVHYSFDKDENGKRHFTGYSATIQINQIKNVIVYEVLI